MICEYKLVLDVVLATLKEEFLRLAVVIIERKRVQPPLWARAEPDQSVRLKAQLRKANIPFPDAFHIGDQPCRPQDCRWCRKLFVRGTSSLRLLSR